MNEQAISSENGKKEAKLLAGTTECLLCLIYCCNVSNWLIRKCRIEAKTGDR